jgi:deoxyribodipyrimidine photolyase-related protein
MRGGIAMGRKGTNVLRAMSIFRRALASHRVNEAGRRWLFVPYDQLTDAVGPLAREAPRELGIIVVECPGKVA